MGKINTDNYPNRPFSSYQDDDMFVLQDNGGETYTTNIGDIKDLIGEETDPKLALKVDKNGTDRLMTAAEGTKLAGIAAGAQVNVLEGVVVDSIEQPISGKKAFIDLSGKTNLSVIAFPFHDPKPDEPQMTFFKGAYVTYNGKLYEFIQEHTGAWNPSYVREIDAAEMFVRAGNGGYNNGDCATCEGFFTKASGNYSHAEGRETQAVGECTHAEGRETIANSIYQHVEGKYNIADNESKYIHIIGNGIDDNNRSNAMTLDWSGNLKVSGEVEDGYGEKISDKTDKVTNATSGHLAGLDSNGNLTDSGVSPTEEVTVEGNPVTFDSPFEQDAKSVVVSVKPIQAGSGTPSPENIRPISGIDEVEIEVSDGESEPTTTTIPLPSTLYGGTVDVTNGDADEKYGFAVFDGSSDEGWQIASGDETAWFFTGLNNAPFSSSVSAVMSNLFKSNVLWPWNIEDNAWIRFGQLHVHPNSVISPSGQTAEGLAEFKAWLANNPLQVCYELATPTTLSFAPADVELLEGMNVVSTNGEKVAVTYGRSLWQDIDDLKTDTEGKLNKSDVADVEGDTASKAYSVNDFMLRADGFYRVTASIAQNASITSSNTTKTTIGAVLTALLNS